MEEVGTRVPIESATLSLNLLNQIDLEDGHQYKQVLNALRKFGDLTTASSRTSDDVGLRPGFSIDTGTLKPDGIPWNLESDKDYKTL